MFSTRVGVALAIAGLAMAGCGDDEGGGDSSGGGVMPS